GILKLDPALARRQVEKLNAVRARRDGAAVKVALQHMGQAAQEPRAPLMEPILEAVEAYASLGEIVEVLTSQFGRYRPPVFI
ncbi:MAG: methylmalonyl-CoA mutase family protein, partial [Thermaerobacter sp.]|nr:methylmalonyl-CoA mutase family protein [Thermaerobacter sp.]